MRIRKKTYLCSCVRFDIWRLWPVRSYREIMYLQAFAAHDNIIRMQHVIKAENGLDVYLTFDYAQTDLLAVVRADVLLPIHVKYVVYQLLKALKFIHSATRSASRRRVSSRFVFSATRVSVWFVLRFRYVVTIKMVLESH